MELHEKRKTRRKEIEMEKERERVQIIEQAACHNRSA